MAPVRLAQGMVQRQCAEENDRGLESDIEDEARRDVARSRR
jgi:hypothetical protein